MDQTITCPHCGKNIPLSETLTKQVKIHLEEDLKKKYELEKKEWELKEKQKMWADAQKKAKEKIDIELKAAQQEIKEKEKRLHEMEEFELTLRKEKRALEEEKRRMTLELERKSEEKAKLYIQELRKQIDEEHNIKLLEKEKQLEQMKQTIAELQRKSEQGSMQIQGDAQESDLKQMLTTSFPMDVISDVPTGIRGADLIQTVMNANGTKAGTILWESKNTKDWGGDWIRKLKSDQTNAKADVSVLVSRVFPDTIKNFGILEGVWVCEYRYVIALTIVLRHHLISTSQLKQSLVGSDEKMKYLYNYLLSSDFQNKIESIISTFTTLQSDLDAERRAMERIWSKREKEIRRVITNTSSLYGDLQGLIGKELPEVKQLKLSENT